MTTVCAAVILFSLISLCQSAPLTCDTLLKPLDTGPDLTGRWYLIALSAENCLAPTLLDAFFQPSFIFDVTSQETPNVYNGSIKISIYGHCLQESEAFFYKDNKMFDVDSNNAPTGEADVLLSSGCQDCVVVKGTDMVKTLMLVSRRKVVTAEELKEFEAQAACLKWSKPHVFRADQDFENCKLIDDISDEDSTTLLQTIYPKAYERVSSMRNTILKCFTEFLVSFFTSEV